MNDGTALARCAWCEGSDLERSYHDREWGVPETGERALFELLTLEGAQAGLAWRIILAKRDGYRQAFAAFDPARIARFDTRRIDRLVADPSIVRHRGKIESVVANARALLALQRSGGSLAALIWSVVGGRPRQPGYRVPADVPARTAESDALAKLLARNGFRFVGSKTCQALMQAAGLTNDHMTGCHRHAEVAAMGSAEVMVVPSLVSSPRTRPTTRGATRSPSGTGRRRR